MASIITWFSLLSPAVLFPGFVHFVRRFHPNFIHAPNEWFMELGRRMIEDRQQTGVGASRGGGDEGASREVGE